MAYKQIKHLNFVHNNYRVSIWGPSPTSMGSWSKGPRNNEFIESGLQNWALAKWTVAKVGLRNNWAQENPVNVHIFSV